MSNGVLAPAVALCVVTTEAHVSDEAYPSLSSRRSSRPRLQLWRSHEIYVVNHGDDTVDVWYSTQGYISGDTTLDQTTAHRGVARIRSREAALVEVADDGAFDFPFHYSLRVRVGHGGGSWHGTVNVPPYALSLPHRRLEDDPVLLRRASVFRPRSWSKTMDSRVGREWVHRRIGLT